MKATIRESTSENRGEPPEVLRVNVVFVFPGTDLRSKVASLKLHMPSTLDADENDGVRRLTAKLYASCAGVTSVSCLSMCV